MERDLDPKLREIAALVAARSGFDVARRDPVAFARRIGARADALGVPPADYLRPLACDPGECERLVESLVVPETRFFRDRDHFDFLSTVALPEIGRRLADSIVRRLSLVSVGCSTGQEAWSLAMTLLEAGDLIPDLTDRRVVGLDLSEPALGKARDGRYAPEEARGLPPDLSERYFRVEDGSRVAGDRLRSLVRFRRANLLDPGFAAAAGEPRAAVVFLKNVLFYLTPEAAKRAFLAAAGLVAPGGWLFLAPSETNMDLPRGAFREVDHGAAIIYQRTEG